MGSEVAYKNDHTFFSCLYSHLAYKGESESEVSQSCPTLCDPMNCNPPGSSVHGILQPRILEWVAIPFLQGIFPTQGLNLSLICLLHW